MAAQTSSQKDQYLERFIAAEDPARVDDDASDPAMLKRAKVLYRAPTTYHGHGVLSVFGGVLEECELALGHWAVALWHRHEEPAKRQLIQLVNQVQDVNRERSHPSSPNDAAVAHVRRNGDRAGVELGNVGEPLRLFDRPRPNDDLVDAGAN